MSENQQEQINQTTETVTKSDVQGMTREELENTIKTTSNAPEDVATAFFLLEAPRLNAAVDQMSKNQMIRFIKNLVAYPLVPAGQELKSELEKNAFYLATQMIQNKTILQLHSEMQKVERAQAMMEAQGSIADTLTNTTEQQTGEQSND